MIIEVQLSGAEFRRFTIVDLLRRRKQWQGPVLFALILGVSAALCFTRTETQGATLLGNVLLTVGLDCPASTSPISFPPSAVRSASRA